MIFPVLKTEQKLQVSDRTRVDATKSYISPDETAITLVEIEPEASVGYFDVTSDKYLDWEYSADGVKTVSLRITTDGLPTLSTKDIEVVTADDDNLFSKDEEIIDYEDDILEYVREGRNSFLDKHRKAQEIILNDLDANKYWKNDGTRYAAEDIVDVQEFKQWSIFLTISLIMESLSNQNDDIYATKANKYRSMELSAKKRATLRLDSDGDGEINENTEKTNMQTTFMTRG